MNYFSPTPKNFDMSAYIDTVSGLTGEMSELEFEKRTEIIVYDILKQGEGFSSVEKGPHFRGTPFDFFGYKGGHPYIVEYKGSLKSFNTPGETQKRRLKAILNEINGLNIALLQVKLLKGQYRILYNDELDRLFDMRRAPLDPILKWIEERL